MILGIIITLCDNLLKEEFLKILKKLLELKNEGSNPQN